MTWNPKTRLGRLVEKGEITNMSDALATRLPIREPEIVDILLPELEDEVLDVNMVQRMTDSGRRVRFAVTAVVGNGNGFVGVGQAKGKEVGPTIRKAIDNAKLQMIEIKRGCGSWECDCKTPHTLPFAVTGSCGSVRVTFKPAPRGIALAVGDVAKPVLTLSGVKDAWAFTEGHTKTTVNYAVAAFDALRQTSRMRVKKGLENDLKIFQGAIPEEEQADLDDEEDLLAMEMEKDLKKKTEGSESDKAPEGQAKDAKKADEVEAKPKAAADKKPAAKGAAKPKDEPKASEKKTAKKE